MAESSPALAAAWDLLLFGDLVGMEKAPQSGTDSIAFMMVCLLLIIRSLGYIESSLLSSFISD